MSEAKSGDGLEAGAAPLERASRPIPDFASLIRATCCGPSQYMTQGGGTMSTLTSRARLLASGAIPALVGTALATAAAAQKAPDFSSNNVGWIAIGGDFTAIPGAGPALMRDDPAHPYVPNGTGGQPSYRIADLSHPNLKSWAKERMKKDNDEVLAGKIGFTPRSSCWPAGVPTFMTYSRFQPIYFLQTAKKVAMIFSGDMQVRHVYLDVPHSEKAKPSWYGESVGHYEGDTLVIDTIGQNDKTFVDNYRTPHTEKLHVTERWKLSEGGNVLEVRIKVEDPDTFYEPWSGVQRFRRVQELMTEEICAENNQHLFDYHIPTADKPDF
jgi:hypothetical protein